ncbi:peptidoglycan/xylan/chitin deacetylase (PgdA/CDA1 family) [Paenibacillus phyllosphaerae]|uniref:Peptidoglycan/xylan/chitin deacetylase (PgdA/CDA1 family) n=1 Tax=Paenibacillus phyllosphaerae TaxID=274593 RepID=A0A7W5AYD0_9BACL|nr:polysaccharide deacetylase family protein [Paenibacillus phyllosphaerae]MBB3111034.1 peptidoglycan/xylan/chitin deacetylase (PgdA/CDA1 family) [Paenibacillus phyllosphaerae]
MIPVRLRDQNNLPLHTQIHPKPTLTIKSKISLILAILLLVLFPYGHEAIAIQTYFNGWEAELHHRPFERSGSLYLSLDDAVSRFGLELETLPGGVTLHANEALPAESKALNFKQAELIQRKNTLYFPVDKLIGFGNYSVNWNPLTHRLSIANNGERYRTEKDALPILMYHHFQTNQNASTIVHPNMLEKQLAALSENGYMTLSAAEAQAYLEGKRLFPLKPVYLTFDDGYESNYALAYPLLQKYNVKATIFVIASMMRKDEGVQQGDDAAPKLTWAQIAEMSASGLVDIQSHTYDLHRKGRVRGSKDERGLVTAPAYVGKRPETKAQFERKVLDDFIRSKEMIEHYTHRPVFVLCYPFGDYSQASESIARKAGFTMTLLVKPGQNVPGAQPSTLRLKRINMTNTDVGDVLLQKLEQVR